MITLVVSLLLATSAVFKVPIAEKLLVASFTFASIIVVLPITKSAVSTNVTPAAVLITILVDAPVSSVLDFPIAFALCIAVLTLPKTTTVLPIVICTPLTKETPAAAEMTTRVISVPVNAVFNNPVAAPCVNVTPILSVISCGSISNIHSFCDTVTPILSILLEEIVFIFPNSIVADVSGSSLPTTKSAEVSKITPAAALITTLVVDPTTS